VLPFVSFCSPPPDEPPLVAVRFSSSEQLLGREFCLAMKAEIENAARGRRSSRELEAARARGRRRKVRLSTSSWESGEGSPRCSTMLDSRGGAPNLSITTLSLPGSKASASSQIPGTKARICIFLMVLGSTIELKSAPSSPSRSPTPCRFKHSHLATRVSQGESG
jgi:hypothetical protein